MILFEGTAIARAEPELDGLSAYAGAWSRYRGEAFGAYGTVDQGYILCTKDEESYYYICYRKGAAPRRSVSFPRKASALRAAYMDDPLWIHSHWGQGWVSRFKADAGL